jgi:hypothetical protein
VLPKILAFLNAQGIGMHTAVSETTLYTFGRGECLFNSYQLSLTSYQLPVTSYQLSVTSYSLFTVLMQYVANNHRIESTIVAKVPTQDSSH